MLGALEGSPAARAGIRYGDILLIANGIRTRNVVDYVEAKALDSRGMDVTLFRQGTEESLRLEYGPSAGGTRDAANLLAELIEMRLLIPAGRDENGGGGNGGGSDGGARS